MLPNPYSAFWCICSTLRFTQSAQSTFKVPKN